MRYIDTEKLKNEIKHLKIDVYDEAHQFDLGARNSLTSLEAFIDSLQQEQQYVDLEKEIHEKAVQLHTAPTYEELENFARHFYELGLKSRKV